MNFRIKDTPENRKLIFGCIKKMFLQHLERLEKKEKAYVKKCFKFAVLNKARGCPVGTIRVWGGVKFIKRPDMKWARYYGDSKKESRGSKMAISALKRKMQQCEDASEMMQIVLLNRDRFSDEKGYPLPCVKYLSQYIDDIQQSRYNNKGETNERNSKHRNERSSKNNRSRLNRKRESRISDLAESYRNEVARKIQKGRYTGYDESIRGRLADLLERRLDSEYGGNRNRDGNAVELNGFKIYSNVNPSTFQEVFWLHKSHLENGELVDFHEYKGAYDDCKCFLSSDGLQGFAIEPDGNIISVYNANAGLENPHAQKGWTKALAKLATENGGDRLDCYDSQKQPLAEIYAKYGFKTVSRMPYNMEYDHDNIAANHNKPDVVFMAHIDKDIEVKNFTKDEYNEAERYRNEIIENDISNLRKKYNSFHSELGGEDETKDQILERVLSIKKSLNEWLKRFLKKIA